MSNHRKHIRNMPIKIIPLPNKSNISIEDALNEDCLEQVFTYLDPVELAGIETVCKRWRSVSRRCSSKRKFLDLSDICNYLVYSSTSPEKGLLLPLLSKYGKQLISLHTMWLFDARIVAKVLAIIGEVCTNLEHLSLDLSWHEHWACDAQVPAEFLKLVSKLKTLTLSGLPPVDNHVTDIVKAATNIRKLVINGRIYDSSFLKFMSENIKHLIFVDTKKTMSQELESNMEEGIQKLTALEVFKADFINTYPLIRLSETCRVLELSDPYHSLEEQDINMVLVRLGFLEVLKLNDYPCSLTPSALESSSLSLKELHLPYNVLSTGSGRNWPHFPKLRKVNATSLINCVATPSPIIEEMLAALIDRSPNLEELVRRCSSCSYHGDNKSVSLPNSRRLVVRRCLPMDDGCLRYLSDNSSTYLPTLRCTRLVWSFNGEKFLWSFSDEELLGPHNLFLHFEKEDIMKWTEFINKALRFIRSSRPNYVHYICRRHGLSEDNRREYKESIYPCESFHILLSEVLEQVRYLKKVILEYHYNGGTI